MTEREDLYTAAGLLLRRMRELADQIARNETDLSKVRQETARIADQWNALMERMKKLLPPSPPT